MYQVEKLQEQGIHEVFNDDMENSYVIKEGKEVLGYVNFSKDEEGKAIWIEYILAKHRGHGDGFKMIEALFDLGYEKIEGTAIYGPHFFWIDMGAVFDEEPDEDIYDGFSFELTKEAFEN